MRTGLIAFGVIFLVLGLLLYFVPMQRFSADTTSSDGETFNRWTSSANINIPVGWAYSSMFIGFILLILGLAIPSSNRRGDLERNSYRNVSESRENVKQGRGKNRKIVRERTERRTSLGGK